MASEPLKAAMWREQAAKKLAANPAMAPHGVLSTYTNYGCRCELCKEARRVKGKEEYFRLHGKEKT